MKKDVGFVSKSTKDEPGERRWICLLTGDERVRLTGCEKAPGGHKEDGARMVQYLMEREMRELNRRADVGARWSDRGIENVLTVLFHYRLNEKPTVPLRAYQ